MASMTREPGAAPKLQRRTWLGRELTRESITVTLPPEAWRAAEERLAAVRQRGLRFAEITRQDFDHPALRAPMAALLQEIRHGRGALILGGFPVDRYDEADIERLYFGLGTYFGSADTQNNAGDLLGRVTDRRQGEYGIHASGKLVLRGYENNSELDLHCDPSDLVGLLCVRQAREGGTTIIADALKIYEILAAERPDALRVLERGWPAHRRGEQAPGQDEVTPYLVPVYGWKDGLLSCKKNGVATYLAAYQALGKGEFGSEDMAAEEAFTEIAARPEVRFETRLQPGEALFTNNFEILHARTRYVDWEDPAARRLMLRLWVEYDPPRPMNPDMLTFRNPSGRKGIDPRPSA